MKNELEEPREKALLEKAVVLAAVIIPFLGTLYAIVMLWQHYVNALDLTLMLVFYFLSGFGITIGFHRLLTHRSFETRPIVKATLLILGSVAVEGNPIGWASAHLEHHAHADQEGDPHSPMVSLWHAHIGWLFKHVARPEVYGCWLRRDPVIVFVDQTWFLWGLLGLAIPFLIAGWSGLIWGGLVRIFITHHATWSVNSICHTFGKRPTGLEMRVAITGWSACSRWARGGTIITTLSRAPRFMVCIGGRSIFRRISSARWLPQVWRGMFNRLSWRMNAPVA